MKHLFILFFYLISFIGFGQSYLIYKGDTINRIDENNKKQGYWVIFGRMEKEMEGYADDQIITEGEYKNNRKEGLWKSYFPNGNSKSEIHFVNNRANGEYKIYYDNGMLEEQGTWKNMGNINEFKRFSIDGCIQQDIFFNEQGKQERYKSYSTCNCLKSEVRIVADSSYEEVKEYDADCKFIGVKMQKITERYIFEDMLDTLDLIPWKGNHTMYKKSGNMVRIYKKGYFKRCVLRDGQEFIYDEKGNLVQIKIYKKGKYIGDAPVDKKQ